MNFKDFAHRTRPSDFEPDPDQIPLEFGDDPLRTIRTTIDVTGPGGKRYVLGVAQCALTGVVLSHSLRVSS